MKFENKIKKYMMTESKDPKEKEKVIGKKLMKKFTSTTEEIFNLLVDAGWDDDEISSTIKELMGLY